MVIGCFGILIGSFLLLVTQRKVEDGATAFKIMLILKSPTSNTTRSIRAGIETATYEYGTIEITEKYSYSDNDSERQNNFLREAISESYELVIISVADYQKSASLIKEVKEQKIKIIVIDNDIEEAERTLFIGSNPKEIGELITVGLSTVNTERDTILAITVDLPTKKEQEIIETLSNELTKKRLPPPKTIVLSNDQDVSKLNQLIKDQGANLFLVSLNEPTLEALQEDDQIANLRGKVSMIAIARSREAISALENNEIRFLIAENPFAMGYQAIASSYLLSTNKFVDDTLYTETKLIDQKTLFSVDVSQFLFSIE